MTVRPDKPLSNERLKRRHGTGVDGPHETLRGHYSGRSEAELAAIRAIEDGRRTTA